MKSRRAADTRGDPPPAGVRMRAYLTTAAAKAHAILTVGYDDPDAER